MVPSIIYKQLISYSKNYFELRKFSEFWRFTKNKYYYKNLDFGGWNNLRYLYVQGKCENTH